MKISVVQRILFLLLFNVSTLSTAQEYTALSDSLKLHIRNSSHVLFHLDSISLNQVQPIIEKNGRFAIYLSSKSAINKMFIEELSLHKKHLIVIGDENIVNDFSKNISVTQVREKDLEFLEVSTQNDSILRDRFMGLQELGRVAFSKDNSPSNDHLLDLWRRSGKSPTFIETNRKNLLKVDSIVSYLNSLRKIFGVVQEESELLSEVSFQNLNGLKVNGFFSYPLLKGEGLPILIPYKTGYNFSPDVIKASPENRSNNKIFSAVQLDLDFGLTDHFIFSSGLSNGIR